MKIGIDLGNTIARAAYLNEQGIPEIVPDFDDPKVQVTPALIHIGQRGCLVGASVETLLENEPDLPVARDFKRLIGSDQSCYSDQHGRGYQAIDLMTLLLRKLIQDAEKAASAAVEGAIIALPHGFGRKEETMIAEAASIAGVSAVECVSEAKAIAHHYSPEPSKRKKVAIVYDLGSSSFTATVVSSGSGECRIQGTAHIPRGGEQIESAIVAMAIQNFRFAHGSDPTDDPIAMVQLQHFIREIKEELSSPGIGSVRKCILLSGKPLDFYLSRHQLSQLLKPLLEETVETIGLALKDASLGWKDIDHVLMSGGNCLLSVIGEELQKSTGIKRKAIRCLQPDFAETFGAAHLTRNLPASKPDPKKGSLKISTSAQVLGRDLVVSSLVPGTRQEMSQLIIKKDSPLPARREIRCMTSKPEQAQLCFNWNLRSDGDEAVFLGQTKFEDLPGGEKGYPVDLVVTAQLDGMIDVSISDPEADRCRDFKLEYRERRENSERERLRTRLQELPINHQ